MAKQGKCKRCRIRVTWSDRSPLSKVPCPRCGGRLAATSRQSNLEVVDLAGGAEATSGDCLRCGVRFTWDEKVSLRSAACPKCGGPLFPSDLAARKPVRDIARLRPAGKLARFSVVPRKGYAYCWSDDEGQIVAVPWAAKKKSE